MSPLHFGVVSMLTDRSVHPGQLAKMIEDAGLDSLWMPEHTHVPDGGGTPYPGGGPLPPAYRRTLDPVVALTVAAQQTHRIRLGFGVCLIAQRDPLVTAKALATMSLMTNGRIDLGVGAGWNTEEIANHGIKPAERHAILQDRTTLIGRLWREDDVTVRTDHVDVHCVTSDPKPDPPPRIFVGGHGPKGRAFALQHAHGWLPLDTGDPSAVTDTIHRMKTDALEGGREDLDIFVYGARADAAVTDMYLQAGATGLLFWLPQGPHASIERRITKLTALKDSMTT